MNSNVKPETIQAIEQRIGAMSKAAKAAGIASKAAADAVEDLVAEVDAQSGDNEEWDDDFDGDADEDDDSDVESKESNDEKVNWNSDRSGRKVNWNSDENKPKKPRKKKPDGDKVNWNSDRERKEADNDEKVNWNSDRRGRKVNWNSDDGDDEDDASTRRRRRKPDGDKVNWNSDRNHRKKEAGEGDDEFVTREEVGEALFTLQDQIKEMADVIGSLTKEIKELRMTDEEKIAAIKEVTPTRSLSDMLRNSNPIGQESTRVKGSTTLGKDGPKETAAPVPVPTTMVPFIDDLMRSTYQNGNATQ